MMTISNPFEKGRKPLPEGTVRDYGGIKFKKQGKKWVYAGSGDKPAEKTVETNVVRVQDLKVGDKLELELESRARYASSKGAGGQETKKTLEVVDFGDGGGGSRWAIVAEGSSDSRKFYQYHGGALLGQKKDYHVMGARIVKPVAEEKKEEPKPVSKKKVSIEDFAQLLGVKTENKDKREGVTRARIELLGYKQTCPRCGGSGNYSFNLQYGTMCFECNGKGTVPEKLTPTLYEQVKADVDSGRFKQVLDEYIVDKQRTKELSKVADKIMAAWKETGISSMYSWQQAADESRDNLNTPNRQIADLNQQMATMYDEAFGYSEALKQAYYTLTRPDRKGRFYLHAEKTNLYRGAKSVIVETRAEVEAEISRLKNLMESRIPGMTEEIKRLGEEAKRIYDTMKKSQERPMLTFGNPFEKGRKPLPEGTVREYGGMKFKKMGGKWVYAGGGGKPAGKKKLPAENELRALRQDIVDGKVSPETLGVKTKDEALLKVDDALDKYRVHSKNTLSDLEAKVAEGPSLESQREAIASGKMSSQEVGYKTKEGALAWLDMKIADQKEWNFDPEKRFKEMVQDKIDTHRGAVDAKEAEKMVLRDIVDAMDPADRFKFLESNEIAYTPSGFPLTPALMKYAIKVRQGPLPKPRLSIRQGTYRDKEGFNIVGKDSRGRSVSIFTESRDKADRIKAAIMGGKDDDVDKILMEKEEALKKEAPLAEEGKKGKIGNVDFVVKDGKWKLADEEEAPKKAAPSPTVKLSSKDPATMTPSEVNKELAKLGEMDSKAGDEVIAAGHGSVPWNELVKIDHPAIKKQIAISDRQRALRREIEMRMGPGYYEMGRGFKARKKAEKSQEAPAAPIYKVRVLKPSEMLLEKGIEERGKRDGTGPHKDSAQRSVSDKGRRKEAGETCPDEEEDEEGREEQTKDKKKKKILEKAKYIKREGSSGNYKYTYKEPEKKEHKERPSDLKYFTLLGAIAQAKNLSDAQKVELTKELRAVEDRSEEVRKNVCARIQRKLKEMIAAGKPGKKKTVDDAPKRRL